MEYAPARTRHNVLWNTLLIEALIHHFPHDHAANEARPDAKTDAGAVGVIIAAAVSVPAVPAVHGRRSHHDLGLRLVVMMMDNLLLRGRRVPRLLRVLRLLRVMRRLCVLNRRSLGNGTAGRGGRGHHHVERLASSQPLRDNDLHQARRRLHPERLAAAHTLRHLHPHLRHRGLDDRLGDRLAHNWIHGYIAEACCRVAGGA
mmetsp:Transcript_4825/g.15852  ORF Transcript_4825/g.15852 Transcript_4825/m.15852 type:complete len:202 (-) Transcript_4825:10-615(-)